MDFAHPTTDLTLGLMLTALGLSLVLMVIRMSKSNALTAGQELTKKKKKKMKEEEEEEEDGMGKDEDEEVVWAPGPSPVPVLGSLHVLGRFRSPWDAFCHLRSVYGDVFRIRLGATECLVVSSMDAIREVLTKKADVFNGRPNFVRYNTLFGGDRDKSLALCDWSEVQKTRRHLAIPYVFPRPTTDKFDRLESDINWELDAYVEHLTSECRARGSVQPFDKLRFAQTVFNIFSAYFCNKRYDHENDDFRKMIDNFDVIFDDMNNGFALDFLPWLLPIYLVHLIKLYYKGQAVRKFLVNTLVQERLDRLADVKEPEDFLDAVLLHTNPRTVDKNHQQLTNEQALYEVEDILGGHSAVSSIWARILDQIARRPDVQSRIRLEVDAVMRSSGHRDERVIRLSDRPAMPYTQAVILETLRVTTSPIVPHVATEESTVGGFRVSSGTMVFLNNYYVNTSDVFWRNPQVFEPDRFLTEEGRLLKPDYFLPFSTGKRSCLGYQLVESISFLATVKLVQHFDILHADVNGEYLEKSKLSVYQRDLRASFVPRAGSSQ